MQYEIQRGEERWLGELTTEERTSSFEHSNDWADRSSISRGPVRLSQSRKDVSKGVYATNFEPFALAHDGSDISSAVSAECAKAADRWATLRRWLQKGPS